MALSLQQMQAILSDPRVSSEMMRVLNQLNGVDINGASASVANKAIGVNASLAKLLAENQQVLDEMLARGQITKEQRDQMHEQAIRKMRVEAGQKYRAANQKLQNTIDLVNANVDARIDQKRRLAELDTQRLDQRRIEANALAAKASQEKGPDTATATAIFTDLESKYDDVGGKVIAAEVKSKLNDQVNAAVKNEIAQQQPQWEKLGIADRLTAKLAGGTGENKGPSLIDELRDAYQRGDSVTEVLDKHRVESFTAKKSEAMGVNAARHMDAIGASQPVADAVVSAMGKPRGSADRMAGMSKARDLARTERRNASIKTGVLGAAGAAAIGLLINKLMGSEAKESQELPLAIRMALMKQMAGGGGGDIKSQSAEAGLEGKNLLNMQRTLGILKLMQDMWSMQTPATSGYAGLV